MIWFGPDLLYRKVLIFVNTTVIVQWNQKSQKTFPKLWQNPLISEL